MSRFDELFNVAKQKAPPESIEPQETAKLSKSKDPYYIRTTVYLPKALHRQLKSVAASVDKEMSEIVENCIAEYLNSRHKQ